MTRRTLRVTLALAVVLVSARPVLAYSNDKDIENGDIDSASGPPWAESFDLGMLMQADDNLSATDENSSDYVNETLLVEEAQGVSLELNYFIGICLSVLATCGGTYGKQAIRLSELRKEDGRPKSSCVLLCTGTVTNTVIGPLLDTAAYAFAPQAVLAPFTGMDIVWNTISAPFTLKEKPTKRRCISAFLVFASAVTSVTFNAPSEAVWDSAYLHHTFVSWRAFSYFAAFGLWFLWGNLRLQMAEKGSTIRGFYYGSIAGSLAGNMFCLKSVAEIVKRNFATGDWSTWQDWLSWALLFGAIFFAVSNIFYMTKGMKHYESMYMVTVYEGSNIVVNSASALIVLNEMRYAPLWKKAGYVGCIGVIVLALVLLVQGEKVVKEKSDGERDAELDAVNEGEDGEEDDDEDEEEKRLTTSSQASRRNKIPTLALICNGEVVWSY